MDILNIDAWHQVFLNSLGTFWANIANFAPSLIGAIIILVIGYMISKIAARMCESILVRVGFDKLCHKLNIEHTLTLSGIDKPGSKIVALVIFWLIMLMFLISVSETIGLDNIAQTIETFVLYLPNVLGAIVIFVIGAAIAGFFRTLVVNAATRLGMDYAEALSAVVYGVLMVVVAILAIDQLQVDTSFLANAIQILLLASGVALAITLGLGSRQISQQLVSGVYARDIFANGDHIQINDFSGVIEEIGTVSSRIALADGKKLQIPNQKLVTMMIIKLD